MYWSYDCFLGEKIKGQNSWTKYVVEISLDWKEFRIVLFSAHERTGRKVSRSVSLVSAFAAFRPTGGDSLAPHNLLGPPTVATTATRLILS